MQRVWHVLSPPTDVAWKYAGRANPQYGLTRSPFCNPFPLAKGAERGSTLTDFFGFMMSNPGLTLLARAEFGGSEGCDGCDGACWCAPPEGLALDDDARCHVQLLGRAIRGDYDRDFARYVALHTAGLDAITEFRGPFWFLSNFSLSPMRANGLYLPTAEHGFHVFKLDEPAERPAFLARVGLDPQAAKNEGRRVRLRPGWDGMSPEVMGRVLRVKYSLEPFASMLDATGDLPLIEGNRWGDRLWGRDLRTGEGRNLLGEGIELRRSINRGLAFDPFAPTQQRFYALGTTQVG